MEGPGNNRHHGHADHHVEAAHEAGGRGRQRPALKAPLALLQALAPEDAGRLLLGQVAAGVDGERVLLGVRFGWIGGGVGRSHRPTWATRRPGPQSPPATDGPGAVYGEGMATESQGPPRILVWSDYI